MRYGLMSACVFALACSSDTTGNGSTSHSEAPVDVFPPGFCGEWVPDDSVERSIGDIAEVSDVFDDLVSLDPVAVSWSDGTETEFAFAVRSPDPTIPATEIAYQSAICGTVFAWLFDVTVDEMGTTDDGAILRADTSIRASCSDTAPEESFLGLPVDVCGDTLTLSSSDVIVADERLAGEPGSRDEPSVEFTVHHDTGDVDIQIVQSVTSGGTDSDSSATTQDVELLASDG